MKLAQRDSTSSSPNATSLLWNLHKPHELNLVTSSFYSPDFCAHIQWSHMFILSLLEIHQHTQISLFGHQSSLSIEGPQPHF